MSKVVLDSSALLALLNREAGASMVAEYVMDAAISAVNLSEVVAKLCSHGMPEREVRDNLEALGLEVVGFEETQAYHCGWLINSTMKKGLSFGDRACLSLAKILSLPALTADKAWSGLKVGITVRVIR
jgi:PIN domain nuclease of toxin-antitoxin system